MFTSISIHIVLKRKLVAFIFFFLINICLYVALSYLAAL